MPSDAASPSENASLPARYFESLYGQDADPWDFATSDYEAAKYAATLSALPRSSYARAFEIGCSIGVLTERLAARCEQLLAVDVAEVALARARTRCAHLPHVRFEQRSVPGWFPEASFDLIVLSEVGYYWSRPDLRRARQLIAEHLQPRGHLLLVHWTPFVEDYPLTGDAVHDAFCEEEGRLWTRRREERAATYRLDLFERL